MDLLPFLPEHSDDHLCFIINQLLGEWPVDEESGDEESGEGDEGEGDEESGEGDEGEGDEESGEGDEGERYNT
jgi:hypothetical protein